MDFGKKVVKYNHDLVDDEWLHVLAKAVERHRDTGKKLQDLNDLEGIQEHIPSDKDEIKECLRKNDDLRQKLKQIMLSYYYMEEWDGEPDFMFLMETPGTLNAAEDSRHREAQHLLESDSIEEQLEIYRKFLLNWLGGTLRNTFTEQFLDKLDEMENVPFSYSSLSDYLPEDFEELDGKQAQFCSDFYVTDVVNYRIKGSDVKADLRDQGMKRVAEEITYIEPEVIFCFGNSAWSALRKNVSNIIAVSNDYEVESGITSVHGGLYKAEFSEDFIENPVLVDGFSGLEVNVIPLGHMSRAKLYLRDSYPEYMKTGLNDLF